MQQLLLVRILTLLLLKILGWGVSTVSPGALAFLQMCILLLLPALPPTPATEPREGRSKIGLLAP